MPQSMPQVLPPITVISGLIGLYLALARGYTGREVQRARTRKVKAGNTFTLPDPTGRSAALTAIDVLQAGTKEDKDIMIRIWMSAVWESWADRRQWVRVIADHLPEPDRIRSR